MAHAVFFPPAIEKKLIHSSCNSGTPLHHWVKSRQETETTRRSAAYWLASHGLHSLPFFFFFLKLRTTCSRLGIPPVAWAFPHELLIVKCMTDLLICQSYTGIFLKSPSSWMILACAKFTHTNAKKIQSLRPRSISIPANYITLLTNWCYLWIPGPPARVSLRRTHYYFLCGFDLPPALLTTRLCW